MKKIKTCLILPQTLPVPAVRGGAVETLAESIAKYNDIYNYLDLTIVSVYDESAIEKSAIYKNTKWIYVKKNIFDIYSDYLFRIIRRISKKSYAIGTYDRKVLRLLKKKEFERIIFEGGNVFFAPHYHKYFSKDIMLFHYHSIERPLFSMKNCVAGSIGISQYVRQVFEEYSDLKWRNYTLLNGIEIEKFQKSINIAQRKALYQKYCINSEDFILLYVGRIIEAKGIRELIQAVTKINNPKIKLMIIGEGTGFNQTFVNEIKSYQNILKKRLIFTGYIPNDKLYQYYQIADCILMPSICEEGAGLVQCEAYATGKPVIVTNRGGIPEYRINEGSIEISLEPNLSQNIEKAILEIIKQVKEGKINSDNIIAQARKFSAENYYLNYVRILKEDMNLRR